MTGTLTFTFRGSVTLEGPEVGPEEGGIQGTDLSEVPDELVADKEDRVDQSVVLKEIIGTTIPADENEFEEMGVGRVKLSTLKRYYEKEDESAVRLLKGRHEIQVDEEFRLRMGTGQIQMKTEKNLIDFHLTVGNCMGFSPLLPNAASDHQFEFEMDLKKPHVGFKGKHGMLGFDPAGRMLYLGHCRNENVYLAMAPNEFLEGGFVATEAGRSSSSSVMSRRHYRQVVMMISHFMEKVAHLPYLNIESVYKQDLESNSTNFWEVTDVL